MIPDAAQTHLPAAKRHLAHIMKWYPDILGAKILDLGSGPGSFLVQAAEAGGDVIGVEPSQELIDVSLERTRALGFSVQVVKGTGEHLPFPDATFGFVNMAEVIEHVEDPEQVLREVHRVLKKGGGVYMSVPNRFGIYDPHFHAYFVNWLPRALATPFLKLVGKDKEDSVHAGDTGRQRLENMHYYTLLGIRRLVKSAGFTMIDIREHKIRSMNLSAPRRSLYIVAYRIARLFYFDTFHIGLTA
jgi:ubiquinone/menaquinone biosynthesis C-methylase UbiE